MPTVSVLSQVDFVNLGALTTTFTAPAACVTNGGYIGPARPANPAFPQWFESCELPTWGDCIPNGAKIDEDFAARDAKHGSNDAVYYHQGSICPDSWTTAGVVAKDGDGKLSASGIFAPTQPLPEVNPTPNIFAEALGPQETAIVCCPSGYTADENLGCHSSVPLESYTAEEVCKRSTAYGNKFVPATFTYGGEQVTGVVATEFGPTARVTSSVTAAPKKNWAAATYIAAVTLVNGGGEGAQITEAPKPKPTKTEEGEQPKPEPTKPAEEGKDKEEDKNEDKNEDKGDDKNEDKNEDKNQDKGDDKNEDKHEDKGDDKGDDKNEDKNEDKGDDKNEDKEVSSSASKKAETKTSNVPTPTPQPTTSTTLTPTKSFTTSKTPGATPEPSGAPLPSGAPQPEDNSAPQDGGDNNNNEGGDNNSNPEPTPGAEGGANGGENPPSAGSARWGSLTATVAAAWGLAAFSGLLIAAL